ncbi:glycoside hydrolase family 15 protein [Pelotomaculum terephthalicicum JT]|uniref:glycoside hydrolase family 15 protein n=1 Tax=Pelotomaculum terephthalicicum TaxID=206393 RepID=UPI0009C6B815|nr:glycoside hydrolase family 15 protein [Pelotomaculum terephthalicicum]MCG9969193.1 glycoside hydrolase family 15 protein [Pelotomaculum terephthalicicum JT]OPX89943.1 MAG: Glycosyl hydrolases family 15 [Pelotomaculum sp. PtaB.Bin117]
MAVKKISSLKTQPEMPEAIVGNSKMLASLRENGEIFRLFWPQIDYGQHLGHFWPGIKLFLPEGQSFTKWFHLNIWQSSQRYLENTNILETEMCSRTHYFKVVQQDFVLPDRDILVRHYTLTNHGEREEKLTFLVYCAFDLDESTHYDGAYLDFCNHSLIFFRRNIYLAVAGSGYPLSGYQCGRRCTHSDPFQNASRGALRGGSDNIRQSAASLDWDMGDLPPGESKNFTLYLAAGADRDKVITLLAGAASQDGLELLEQTKQYWRGWLRKGTRAAGENAGSEAAYGRSLLAMKLMSNKETGASIAAPEFDPYYLLCGGYGYCWPRDSVFIAAAFDEAGYHDIAAHFYKFAGAVQEKAGDWQQRYFTDGLAAPTWGKQIDQAGSVLWGYGHHYSLTRDNHFLEQTWSSLAAGADYLAENLEANGLPSPSFDLWEDEHSQGTYSAAAVYGGLKAASEIAIIKGERETARRWHMAAAAVKEGILKHQWSDRHHSFIRGINRRVCQDSYHHAAHEGKFSYTQTDPAGLYPTYWVGEDERLDAALLGLAFPFGVLDAKDEKMQATVRAIEERLWNRDVGGLRRYEGDSYRGGNPWLVTTFWLAIYYCMRGDRHRAKTLYRWCLEQANRHLLLPEQADKNRGGPAWVMPLNWSHAMLVLARLALEDRLSIISIAKT